MRSLLKNIQLRDGKKNSPTPGKIRTQNFSVKSCVLYHWAKSHSQGSVAPTLETWLRTYSREKGAIISPTPGKIWTESLSVLVVFSTAAQQPLSLMWPWKKVFPLFFNSRQQLKPQLLLTQNFGAIFCWTSFFSEWSQILSEWAAARHLQFPFHQKFPLRKFLSKRKWIALFGCRHFCSKVIQSYSFLPCSLTTVLNIGQWWWLSR